MEKGDLFFKTINSHYDSWRTVHLAEVYHYEDKTKVLATVTNKAKKRPFNNYLVIIPEEKYLSKTCDSMNSVLEFIIEHYSKKE